MFINIISKKRIIQEQNKMAHGIGHSNDSRYVEELIMTSYGNDVTNGLSEARSY